MNTQHIPHPDTTVELLDAPPPVMRRPLALIDGHAYAATWLYTRTTRSESHDKHGHLVQHDPPLVETGLRLHVLRDDGALFGPGGDHPLDALGLDVILPEMPPPSRAWSTHGVKAYRAGARPDPLDVLNRVAGVVTRFVDFDHSLADQSTMAELVACFILTTWLLDAFNVVGYLWPSGERGSGKTVLLHTVAEMAYLGHVILAGGTFASLRDLAEYGATLAFDDAENLSDPRQADPDKRALLLAGNRRGSTVTMKEFGPDKLWHTRHLNAFCPRLFSAIRLPDNVLASRSIVIPLIRTADRHRTDADPLDYQAWPHDHRQLVDDLWALALAHLPTLHEYERAVNDQARLAGRALEPWRAILAVALWLEHHDPQNLLRRITRRLREDGYTLDTTENGLWERLEGLSVRYQTERSGLEAGDLTVLVLRALCVWTTRAIEDAIRRTGDAPYTFVVTTDEVVTFAKTITQKDEGDPATINHRTVGHVLGHMRLPRVPRSGGQGSRRWKISCTDLARWTAAYGLPLPRILEPPPPDYSPSLLRNFQPPPPDEFDG